MAQYNLGVIYGSAQGDAQDDKQAAVWFHKAANQGFVPAQYFLGLSYADSKGVEQDYKQAVFSIRKAAMQGYAAAQSRLGLWYALGSGVPQDYGQTYAWLSVAAANGDPKSAEARDLAAKELSPSKLEEMQALATQYFEQYQPAR